MKDIRAIMRGMQSSLLLLSQMVAVYSSCVRVCFVSLAMTGTKCFNQSAPTCYFSDQWAAKTETKRVLTHVTFPAFGIGDVILL